MSQIICCVQHIDMAAKASYEATSGLSYVLSFFFHHAGTAVAQVYKSVSEDVCNSL